MNPEFTPLPFQAEDQKRMDHFDGRVLLAWDMGLGKAQPLDARILTPNGWAVLGDIEVGDFVIGSDGQKTRVTGVFPQGDKTVYRVTMRDGVSTECCEDHLWSVRRIGTDKYRTSSTKELMSAPLRDKTNWRWFIPTLSSPVQFRAQKDPLPLDPYLVGYLIGNGCLRHGVQVSIPDDETVERIESLLPAGCKMWKPSPDSLVIDYSIVRQGISGSNALLDILRRLGLQGKYSYQKSIPAMYLTASVEDRIALLQGLMDSDGSVSTNHLEYSTSSKELADDVQDLIECLGGCGFHRMWEFPQYMHNGEKRVGRPSYTVSIKLPSSISPFRLSRKIEGYKPSKWSRPTRSIVKIEEIGVKPCACIAVDAEDHLYVTDHGIITHNTVQALHWLQRHPEAYPALVICPGSVKFNWAYEANHFFGIRAAVCESQKHPDLHQIGFTKPPKLTIINYDIVHFWLPYLKKLGIKTVILDEVQNLIHETARKTKATLKIAHGKPHLLALSGTPLTNRPYDLYTCLSLLWPEEFGSRRVYAETYCSPKWTPWGMDYTGSSNLDDLHRRITKLGMIRRRFDDVIKDLPPKVWNTIPCEIDVDEYKEASNDFTGWLKKVGKSKSLKAEKVTRVGHLLRLAAKLKIRTTVDWANQFLEETEQKLIMFAIHKKAVDVLERRINFKSIKIDGSVSMRRRQEAVEQFKCDPKTRLCVGSAAAGTGVNGLQVANTVGIVEFPYRPGDLSQWVGRAHRIGQCNTVFVNMFVAVGTIEEDLVRLLQKKQKSISAILDGGETPTDTNIYEELLEVIEGRIFT